MSTGLTPNQKSHITYNSFESNKTTTNVNLENFEESYSSVFPINPDQLWIDSDKIPNVNPLKEDTFGDGTIYEDSGDLIFTKFHKKVLTFDEGSANAFYDNTGDLVNCIPPRLFGIDYQAKVWKYDIGSSTWLPIPLGQNDWIFNYASGVLTFLNGLPEGVTSANPPSVTTYRYEGGIGFPASILGGQGYQGRTGPQGIDGTQGLQGVQGVQGVQGSQGLQGIQGIIGPQGNQGRQGPQGTQGVQGTQGIQGIQGSGGQGASGPQGTQGDVGPQGANGARGFQGFQGDNGQQGNQGDNGSQGNQGSQGDCCPCPDTIQNVPKSNSTDLELVINNDTTLVKIGGSPGSTFQLIGIDSDYTDTRKLIISNETNQTMTIVHGSGLVSGSNSILLPSGSGTYTVASYGAARLIYSDTTNGGVGAWQLL